MRILIHQSVDVLIRLRILIHQSVDVLMLNEWAEAVEAAALSTD